MSWNAYELDQDQRMYDELVQRNQWGRQAHQFKPLSKGGIVETAERIRKAIIDDINPLTHEYVEGWAMENGEWMRKAIPVMSKHRTVDNGKA